jgi:endonuclease YncB( thermonuclease family)
VRLADIDAPEVPGSPKCEGWRAERAWCDFALGYRSRDELRAFLASGPVGLIRKGEDKYGRTLAVVEVGGQSAGAHLVTMGLARPWD